MSSDSGSRESSAGPSSFTENLTLYMNGQREPVFAIPAAEPVPISKAEKDAKAQMESLVDGKADMQTLRDELEAALKRHNELMAENGRLRKDLEDATAKALRVGPLERELEEARSNLQETLPQLESAKRQLDVNRLRTDELEEEIAKQTAHTHKAREDESQRAGKLEALQKELERQEERRLDELDDQSTIDELEDELERTRHELDKAIKARQRVERQLEFTKADYEAEKQRNEELQGQLSLARKSEKQLAELQVEPTSPRPPMTPRTPGTESMSLPSSEAEALRKAVGRAETRIDGLESQLKEARSAIKEQSEEFASTSKQAEKRAQEHAKKHAEALARLEAQHEEAETQAEERGRAAAWTYPETTTSTGKEDETAMDRAAAYIRKLKAQEAELKRDLKATRSERDQLRVQLRDTEDECKQALSDVQALSEQVGKLEDTKDRMGRVLMYHWGKEEVGEIERRRGDGKKERGMGFKYKYFNKDGTVKEAS